MVRTTILITLVAFAISCSSNRESLTPKQFSAIQDSVRLMAETISKNVSRKGPVAWLECFENTADFFMASEGQLVFPNYDSAKNFINNTLVKSVSKIDLKWSNIRIDPLTGDLANFAAIFHEDITDTGGRKMPENGYLTALARQTSKGWQLRNAHWSMIATR